MKKFYTLLLILPFFYSNAQTVCGTASEGGTVTLTAPSGYYLSGINFASYGTPNGSCGSFTLGGCNSLTSVTVSTATFVGQTSASINATNVVFGDPCVGTAKRLYVEAAYSTILPLRLLSFSARKLTGNNVMLNWSSSNEINTSEFSIEKSSNGVSFERTGTVQANGSGTGNYSFSDNSSSSTKTIYYRLKMIDRDGKFQYSNIVRVQNTNTSLQLSLFPNPAKNYITIESAKQQQAVISNAMGQTIQKINLVAGDQAINIEQLQPGIYFIKTFDAAIKFFKAE